MPFTRVHGNGGLLSTIDDLLRWNEALTNGFPGAPGLTALLETTGRLTSGRPITYALGLTVTPWSAGVREVSHSGSTAGYRTWLARYPEARTSVAVWCNAATANAGALGRQVAELILPRTAASRPAPAPIAADARSRLVGTYRDPRTDSFLGIAAVGDYLRVVGPSSDSLRPEGGAGRYATSSGHQLTFAEGTGPSATLRLRSPDGEVMEMVRDAAPTVDGAQLAALAGTYRSPELGSTITIRHLDGRLVARISPDEEGTLTPFYRDGFRAGAWGMTIRFTRNAAGAVDGARVFAGRARNVRYDRVE
jgi:hypothetical protein